MYPSVNSIFNPDFIDNLYPRSAENRQSLIADARATNYGVVRLELIEHLYEKMYEQRRELGPDESKWPHRILGATDLVGVSSDDTNQEKLRLQVRNLREQSDYVLDVDLIIAATGYKRTGHLTMLDEGVAKLLPDVASGSTDVSMNVQTKSSGIEQKNVKVARDYSLQFAPGKVARGSGIWLQGCNESTHGVSFLLLSSGRPDPSRESFVLTCLTIVERHASVCACLPLGRDRQLDLWCWLPQDAG
jgi:L-ornithine N5-monooxygenase